MGGRGMAVLCDPRVIQDGGVWHGWNGQASQGRGVSHAHGACQRASRLGAASCCRRQPRVTMEGAGMAAQAWNRHFRVTPLYVISRLLT